MSTVALPLQAGLVPKTPITLSHSKKEVMQTCGRLYKLKYVDRLERKVKTANLGFGDAVHQGTSAVLTAQAFGLETDPVPVFNGVWKDFVSQPVEYSSIWSEEKFAQTGQILLTKFVEDWRARGWTPLVDPDGNPVIEREFKVLLPDNITYIAIIDAVVRTADGKILVLDFKTPGNASMEDFACLSDQLLGYQVVVEAHKEALGIERVDGLVFYELIKRPPSKSGRGEGPTIHVEDPVPPRSALDIAEWIQELQFVADDIRRKRFSKRPMAAWNTPCALCDMKSLCTRNSMDELQVRPDRRYSSPQKARFAA